MSTIPNIIGHLSNVVAYIYDNKNCIILEEILNKKYEFNKSYAIISNNIINDYGYYNESLLKVISFIKNVQINECNKLTYEIDNEKSIKPKVSSNIKFSKELYIKDSCNLCTFVKEKYTLENIYDYPQFIVEYTDDENEDITQLFRELFVNNEISKFHNQEMNELTYKMKVLQEKLQKIKDEEEKNKKEINDKIYQFVRSKL